MKEYKIIKQKGKFLGDADEEFETILNNYAREGWEVQSTISLPHSNLFKVILVRDKSR